MNQNTEGKKNRYFAFVIVALALALVVTLVNAMGIIQGLTEQVTNLRNEVHQLRVEINDLDNYIYDLVQQR